MCEEVSAAQLEEAIYSVYHFLKGAVEGFSRSCRKVDHHPDPYTVLGMLYAAIADEKLDPVDYQALRGIMYATGVEANDDCMIMLHQLITAHQRQLEKEKEKKEKAA